jgi:hypothetical protein
MSAVRELSLFKNVFSTSGYEIIKYLDTKDIESLRLTNKYINDICECHSILTTSFKNLNNLFNTSVENTDFFKKLSFFDDSIYLSTGQSFASNITGTSEKKSKFKEKYTFNKPIDEYYTESDKFKHRLQSAKRNINK